MNLRVWLGLGAVAIWGAAVGVQGCGGSGSVEETGSGGSASNGTGSSQGGNNGTGGDLFSTSSNGGAGSGGDDSCANVTQEATLTNRPVDIIVAIDNSGSMGGEIFEVEAQITQNFATILDNAMPAIDYRVIMVARYGSSSGPESICVSAPLGGIPDMDMDGHCDTLPAQPVETMNFFHHSVEVSSHNALCRLLEQYDVADEFNLHPNGYKDLLRQEAFKFFLVITDDGVSCSFNGNNFQDGDNVNGGTQVAADWDTAILALDPAQFGTDMNRNYVFWSIISQAPFMANGMKPYGDPVPATEPVTSSTCTPGAADPGTGYQGLSVLTEGFRYPTCGLEYTDIFTLMAQGVIAGSQVPCEFGIPDPPAGEELDLDTVEVIYSSNGMPVDTYTKVADANACTPTSFYIDSGNIILCPGACSVVQADENAKIDLSFDCKQVVE